MKTSAIAVSQRFGNAISQRMRMQVLKTPSAGLQCPQKPQRMQFLTNILNRLQCLKGKTNARMQFLINKAKERRNRTYQRSIENRSKRYVFTLAFLAIRVILLSYVGMFGRVYRRPKQPRRPLQTSSYETQSINELRDTVGKEFSSVRNLIGTFIPAAHRDTLLGISIVSSLFTLVLSIIQFAKQRTTITGTMIVTTIITVLVNILSLGTEEEREAATTFVETMTQFPEVLTHEYDERILHLTEETDSDDLSQLNQREIEFLNYLKNIKPLSKYIINQIHYRQFKDVVLPTSTPPTTITPLTVKPYRIDFRYPNWFLRAYWIGEDYSSILKSKIYSQEKPNGVDFVSRMSIMLDNVSVEQADENISEDDIILDHTSDEESAKPTPVEPSQPSTSTKKLDPSHYVIQTEIDVIKMIKKIGLKIVCILIYIFDVTTTKQKFSVSGLLKAFRLVEDVNRESSDLKELYNLVIGKETPTQALTKKMEDYRETFQKFMEAPTFKLAEDQTQVYSMKAKLKQFNDDVYTLTKEQKADYQSIIQLSVTTNSRIQVFFQHDIKQLSRQEPFVVIVQGSGGTGKTTMLRKIAKQFCEETLGLNYALNYTEVTPDDKYWPPFQGQTIAFFDDCATVQDLKDDLLFKNIKNICSPTMYNAAAADINHKINPINFRVIFATTNTPFKDIGTRLTSIYDPTTTESCFRRMICVKADWNPKCGELKQDEVEKNNYKEDDSHLILTLMKYDKGNVNKVKTISKSELIKRITDKEAFYNRNYNLWKMKSNMVPESNAKTHYSINLNGRAGQGKTEAAKRLMTNLSLSLNLPAFYIASFDELAKLKTKSRCILVLDDILRVDMTIDEENVLMDLYNSRLQNDSVIIWTTNVSPSKTLPCYTGTALVSQRKLPFQNEGLARRAGFAGFFKGVQQPSTGCEFRVNNMRYYEIKNPRSLNMQMLCQMKYYFIALFLILLYSIYLFYVPFPILLVWFYFGMDEEEIQFQQLSEYLFTKYRSYTFNRNEIKVEYVSEIPLEKDFNLYIDCSDSRTFMDVSSAMEADKHVFLDFNRFCQSNRSWKIYLTHEVMSEMQRNVERYMLNSYNFDEDSVIALISRYVQAFAAANVLPKFYAHFGDIGTFHFANNVLKIKRRSVLTVEEQEPPVIVFHGGEFKILYKDTLLSFREAIKMDNSQAMLKGFNYKECQQFFTFVKSPQFLQNPYYLDFLKSYSKQQMKEKLAIEAKRVKDKFQAFAAHPFGIATIAILGLISSIILGVMIKKMFTSNDSSDSDSEPDMEYEQQKKKGRKGSPKKKKYDSDDDKKPEKKKGRKGSPKKKKYDSDDDKVAEKKKGRKGSPKSKKYASDDDTHEKEDVLTLTDMNDFRALKPYFNIAFEKARKNLCQVYAENSNKDILTKEPKARACYGLFIKDTMFVTVGHLVNQYKNMVYVGKDDFNGKFYKATFVCRPANRDISIWRINGVTKQPDLTKFFLKDAFYTEDDTWNAVLQRFAPGKKEEFHTSKFTFWPGPEAFDSNGTLTKFGEASYASFGIKLTDGGDCGLPYYIAEMSPVLSNKILGIHCMGNRLGVESSGILSVITQEDISQWSKIYYMHQAKPTECKFCCGEMMTLDDDNPKCKDHKTTWHSSHDSSWATFIEEYQHYIEFDPKFIGGIIKNSGSLKGTVEHSHTQFLPFCQDVVETDVSPWRGVDLSDICSTLNGDGSQITVEVTHKQLMTYIKNYHKFGNDFRIRAYRYIPLRNSNDYKLRIQITIVGQTSTQPEINDIITGQTKQITFTPHFGAPIHVDPAMHAVLQGAINNKERGKLEDVPFAQVDDNQTVRVIGSFCQSKSHTPADHYKKSPFSQAIKHLIPMDKAPCVYDINRIPKEYVDRLVINNYGEPCQRATLSLAWAHKNAGCRLDFKEVKEEFRIKIKSFYSGLRLLTDEEVLGGIKDGNYCGYVNGMELDTSIGFMMKELFYVSKKRDVLMCNENGKYSWLNNPASSYLKQQYEEAKKISDNGDKYLTIFLELLKMEKLKIADGKNYKGRTFVAQDVLGVLMERRNLGHLCAKAYKDDPNCGIGVDPIKTFNKIYIRMERFPNKWAGDYKNFDRNTPSLVQKLITELLCEENPRIANQIKATMRTNIERLQVSGTTLFEVHGGMPSGCFTTAPLNSLNNEFLMYSSFHFLCIENGIAPSWKLYNDNVERIYYGDDVMVSVSNAFKEIFTRSNVSVIMKNYFGMILDSSAKDGSDATFDTYETASWISRYFRKLGKFGIYCGALKKISIHANFHYVSSVELEHLGTLMERAQWEAALWEPEFFDKIQQAILICCKLKPALRKYVQPYSQKVIQQQMYDSAIATAFPYSKEEKKLLQVVEDWGSEVEQEMTTSSQFDLINFFQSLLFKNNYQKRVISRITMNSQTENFGEKIAISYTMKLNEYYQTGKTSKPEYSYSSQGPTNQMTWYATCDLRRVSDCQPFQSNGRGLTKAEAREGAAYEMLVMLEVIEPLPPRRTLQTTQLEPQIQEFFVKSIHGLHYRHCVWSNDNAVEGPDTCVCVRDQLKAAQEARKKRNMLSNNSIGRCFNFKCYEKQSLNVTPGSTGQTPHAPLVQTDVSVVSDSGLFTNTQIPTPMRIYNSTGIALDNPAGTGAPFNKHISVYNIYQRWEDNNTTISPSMSSGSRVLTLSLDPQKLPSFIKEYVSFHDSIIPAIDISISIAGAAGTIGWLAVGWVKDGSKTNITLDDLQQVSMETTNMNGTQVINTKLTDVRRTGLYRKTKDDPEPYPALVMLIDHAVTNVQRNDGVNYPVRVQVKLAQECVLMEPFSRSSDTPNLAKFNLGSYFYDEGVDMLVGASAAAQNPENEIELPDMGYNTDEFKPAFTRSAFSVVKNYSKRYVMCAIQDQTPDATFLAEIQDLSNKPEPAPADELPPSTIIIAFGKVDKLEPYYEQKEPTIQGSVYKVDSYAYCGNIRYNITELYTQPEGCYLIAKAQFDIHDFQQSSFIIYTGCKEQKWITEYFDNQYQPAMAFVRNTAVLYKDPNHNNTVVGDYFSNYTSHLNNTEWRCRYPPELEKKILVYVQTGNSMPSYNLPTGLKQLVFVRSGTTSTVKGDLPFVPITKPLLKNAIRAFSELLDEKEIDIAKGNIEIDGENKGEIGFDRDIFFVRTDDYKKLLVRIGYNVKITNISRLSSPQALAAFNTTSLSDWTTSSKKYKRGINFTKYELQSAIAGGAIMGLGQGIGEWSKQMFQKQMLEKMQKANAALQGANNDAIAKRQKDAFERNLQLTGYNSSSAQFGLIGPRQENQMDTSLYRNLDSSFRPGGIINPSTSTQGTTTFDATGNAVIDVSKATLDPPIHDVTKFQDNPAFKPAPRNQLIENAAAEDVEPIDPALDKDTASPTSNVIVHANKPNQPLD